jgi:hypothetical protein
VVQDQATEIKETAVSEIKTWAITAIIQAAIPKILSMFNPAGAIVQAILAIYKAVTWFVMNFERIIQWAKAVFDSIAHIASGAIGEATKKVEETMGRSLGLVITFLASQIGLGKVGDAIKKVIQKVRQPIEKVVDKVVKWIADKAKKLFKKVKGLFKKDKKKDGKLDTHDNEDADKLRKKKDKNDKNQTLPQDGEIGEVVYFTVNKHKHRLWVSVRNGLAVLMVNSNEQDIINQLNEWKGKLSDIKEDNIREDAKGYLIQAASLLKEVTGDAQKLINELKDPNKTVNEHKKLEGLDKEVEFEEQKLGRVLWELFTIFELKNKGFDEKEILKLIRKVSEQLLLEVEYLINMKDLEELTKDIDISEKDFRVFAATLGHPERERNVINTLADDRKNKTTNLYKKSHKVQVSKQDSVVRDQQSGVTNAFIYGKNEEANKKGNPSHYDKDAEDKKTKALQKKYQGILQHIGDVKSSTIQPTPTDGSIAKALLYFIKHRDLSTSKDSSINSLHIHKSLFAFMSALMLGQEVHRNSGALANGLMVINLLADNQMTWQQAIGKGGRLFAMAEVGAVATSKYVKDEANDKLGSKSKYEIQMKEGQEYETVGLTGKIDIATAYKDGSVYVQDTYFAQRMKQREIHVFKTWMGMQTPELTKLIRSMEKNPPAPNELQIKDAIKEYLKEQIRKDVKYVKI